MQGAGELAFEPQDVDRYIELWLFSCFQDLSQELSVEHDAGGETLALASGWCRTSLGVPAGTGRLALKVNKLYPPSLYPGDGRSLAIRVRDGAFVHPDAERHRNVRRQYQNRIANWRELLAGVSRLESTPALLGIDMHGACNVKPPCVYCDWDVSKRMEGGNVDAPFTPQTLASWGPIFEGADTLVNCSIGEPFMMRHLDELFDIFGDRGKALEMTTNGQILTDRNIATLLGREIDLYVSLDSATPATYARLRNDTFDRILENLRRLVKAKGGRGGLPRLHLVFMPMRCNVEELEAFVDLCAELEVDRLVLRPLNSSDGISLNWDRQGQTFDYPKQILPFDELIRHSARAAALCREKHVPFSDQLDFGVAMGEMFAADREETEPSRVTSEPAGSGGPIAAAHVDPAAPSGPDRTESLGEEKLPLCKEPWTSLYILRRGIHPCCYGGHPVAEMDEFHEAWNCREVREIRSELAAGRFHRYCLRSPACPIVRKDSHAGSLPPAQAVFVRGRQLLQRLDRRLLGIPGRLYRPLRKAARRLLAR